MTCNPLTELIYITVDQALLSLIGFQRAPPLEKILFEDRYSEEWTELGALLIPRLGKIHYPDTCEN